MPWKVHALRWLTADHGSAVVDFVLVLPLLISTFVAVGELTMIAQHRSVLVSALEQGVRVASVADGTLNEGAARTRSVLADHDFAEDQVKLTLARSSSSGVHYVVGSAHWPTTAMGIDFDISATARSIDESAL